MTGDILLQSVMYLVPLLLSLTVHEFAHAWSAWMLGDDTAARMGRLTLNPIPHIDPIGTLLMPLLQIPFGWAKPVPVNPARFRRTVNMRTGMMITALAGPASNAVLAVLAALGYGLLARWAPETAEGGLHAFLMIIIQINVALAIFNMIPIPPLDGSRVVDGLLPLRLRGGWERFERFAPFVLMGVIVLSSSSAFPGSAAVRAVFDVPRTAAYNLLSHLIAAVAT